MYRLFSVTDDQRKKYIKLFCLSNRSLFFLLTSKYNPSRGTLFVWRKINAICLQMAIRCHCTGDWFCVSKYTFRNCSAKIFALFSSFGNFRSAAFITNNSRSTTDFKISRSDCKQYLGKEKEMVMLLLLLQNQRVLLTVSILLPFGKKKESTLMYSQ